jgi:hypothetical protein
MPVSTMIESESKVPVKMKSESAGIDNNQYDNISSVQYSTVKRRALGAQRPVDTMYKQCTQCTQKNLDKYNK